MKILYLGNWNPFVYSTEKLIKEAFEELGHEVICCDERSVNAPSILKQVKAENIDLFFFHKGTRWGFQLDQLVELLMRLTCKKAFWYFDPIHNIPDREMFMQAVVPLVDRGFLTNGTWIKQHTYKNLTWLLQGCKKEPLGKFRKEYDYDVVFIGSPYGARQLFVNGLEKKYGDKFKVFSDVFGEDFNDLCASAKVIVSPKFPANDWFWSNRVYKVLGAGGFLIHPYCEGLKDHYESGKDYETYIDQEELFMKIDHYLKHEKERRTIQKSGYERSIKEHTYTNRVKIIIKELGL